MTNLDLIHALESAPDAAALFDVERPKITFAALGGMEKLKEAIRMKIIYPLAQPDLFRAYGKAIGGGGSFSLAPWHGVGVFLFLIGFASYPLNANVVISVKS